MNEKSVAKRASSPTIELLKATSRGKIFKVVQAIDEGAELAVNKVSTCTAFRIDVGHNIGLLYK